MPRYFFDVHDGIDVRDAVGRDLPDLEAAQVEAVRVTGEHAADPRAFGGGYDALVVEVRDIFDAIVLRTRLSLKHAFG